VNIDLIETNISNIIENLEREAMEIISNQSLDKKQTNLRMKPLTSTKQILLNALDSIKMVERVNKEEMEG